MGLVFAMGQDFFEKTGFRQKWKFRKNSPIFCEQLIFLSFGEISTFLNAYAIQTNLGTKELLKQNCAREYGLLEKQIRN